MKNEKITVERYANEGYGIGKKSNGKIVFIPFAIINETYDVQIIQEHKDYDFGIVSEIIKTSEHRIVPECPIFTVCGGCNFLHVSYEYELEIKKQLVIDTIKSLSDLIIEPDFVQTIYSQRFYYRNNAQIKVTDKGQCGFYKQKTLKIIPFPPEGCKLLTKEMTAFLLHVPEDIFLFTKGFRFRFGNDIYTANLHYQTDSSSCKYQVNDFSYTIGINDFFQVNSLLLNKFQDFVASLIDTKLSTIELYGGSGFFSLPVSKKVSHLLVNELSKTAVENAKKNATLNNCNSISFFQSDALPFIKKYSGEQIIVDPPRDGLNDGVCEMIVNNKIKRIIYISCNPITFARDLKKFLSHRYSLINLHLIDNFPSTYHTELIAVITKKG